MFTQIRNIQRERERERERESGIQINDTRISFTNNGWEPWSGG